MSATAQVFLPMAALTTIRRSLIFRLVTLVLLTTGTLVVIAVIGAYRAGDDVAREFVRTAAEGTREKTDELFRAVEQRVFIAKDWIETGRLAVTDYETLNDLFLPVLLRQDYLSSLLIADSTGAGYMLLRDPLDPNVITNRLIDPAVENGTPRLRVWNRATGEVAYALGDPEYDPRNRLWF
ncbi:MAG: hypothetical protein R3284_11060, partial [Rubricoccaceae bacterium]|nr:hypothetical protein [Rubricoccaceae bacterium]